MKILRPGLYEEFFESLHEYNLVHGNCLYIPFRSKLEEYKNQINSIGKELDVIQRKLGYSYETFKEFSIDVYSLCGMIEKRDGIIISDTFIVLENLYTILNDFPYCIVNSTLEMTTKPHPETQTDIDMVNRINEAMKNLLNELSVCLWYVHILIESLLSPSLVYTYKSLSH